MKIKDIPFEERKLLDDETGCQIEVTDDLNAVFLEKDISDYPKLNYKSIRLISRSGYQYKTLYSFAIKESELNK